MAISSETSLLLPLDVPIRHRTIDFVNMIYNAALKEDNPAISEDEASERNTDWGMQLIETCDNSYEFPRPNICTFRQLCDFGRTNAQQVLKTKTFSDFLQCVDAAMNLWVRNVYRQVLSWVHDGALRSVNPLILKGDCESQTAVWVDKVLETPHIDMIDCKLLDLDEKKATDLGQKFTENVLAAGISTSSG